MCDEGQLAKKARVWVGKKRVGYGVFADGEAEVVAALPVPPARLDFPDRAWHAADAALSNGPREDVRSTLDAGLQAELERIALTRAEREGQDVQVSAIVVHVPTRAVRALVGSASRDRAGGWTAPVSHTDLRAHQTKAKIGSRRLLEKKKYKRHS